MQKELEKLSINERRAILEEIVNGESLKREMIRKATQYPKDYDSYLRTAEVTDSLRVGSDKEGGYLVPDEMEDKIVEALNNKGVMRKLSNVFKTQHSMKFPGAKHNVAAHWIEEGGELIFDDEEFFQVIIDAHKNGYTTLVTEELLEDAGFPIEDYIIDTAVEKIGEIEEEAFVKGDGITKPRGVLLDAPVAVETSELTMDDALDLLSSVSGPYRKNAVWLMSEEALRTLHKFKSACGRNIWSGDMAKGLPLTLFGKPVYTSDAMPDMAPGNQVIAFGDFSYYWIGDRGNNSIKRLNELYADRGQVGFRVTHRVDGKLVLPEAIKTLKMAS